MARCAASLCTAFVCVAASLLPAQQVLIAGNERHEPIAATAAGLTLPAGQLSLVELVESVAGYLCRNYFYDFDAVGKATGVQLQHSLALDAPGAEEVLLAVLASRGFVALPIDEPRGIWQIVDLGTPQRALPVPPLPWRSPEEIERRPRLRDLVMTAVPLANMDAGVLAAAIRDFFSLQGMWHPGVPTACAAGPRLLLLYGFRDQLAQALVAVQQIDRLATPSLPTAPPATPSPADYQALVRRIDALEREVQRLRTERTRPR